MPIEHKGPSIADRLRNFTQAMRSPAYVSVGVHSDAGDYEGTNISVAQVALWNEFGTPNAKHPSPERSFLRSTIRENKAQIDAWRAEALRNCLTKGWTVEKGLEMIGTRLVFLIQNKIKSSIPPPNAEWTLRRKEELKQGTTTLIATGKLLRSIGYRVHSADKIG